MLGNLAVYGRWFFIVMLNCKGNGSPPIFFFSPFCISSSTPLLVSQKPPLNETHGTLLNGSAYSLSMTCARQALRRSGDIFYTNLCPKESHPHDLLPKSTYDF
jgi:hypothetical protein